MVGIFSYMVGSQVSSILTTTGAFEVFYNDIQIWSKFEKRVLPRVSDIIEELERLGLTVQN